MNRLLEMAYTEYARDRENIHGGFISGEHVDLLRDLFNIENLTDKGLQELRNSIVKFFRAKEEAVPEEDWKEDMWLMDCMSAWVAVVDQEKWNRGMEV